jgi:hypothetical protein
MAQLTIRQTSAELPGFDPEMALEPLPRLDAASRLVADFQFGDATVDALVVDNAQLLRGRIRTLRAGPPASSRPAELKVTFGDELPGHP